MLRRRDDVRSIVADNIEAEIMMTPNITRSVATVRNPDLRMTIAIGMPKAQL